MKYILSEQAEAALADIYGYSAYSHGEIQAEEYIEALYQTFERLSKWSQIGKDASEYLQGLKQYRCNKHYIFYTVEKTHIISTSSCTQAKMRESILRTTKTTKCAGQVTTRSLAFILVARILMVMLG